MADYRPVAKRLAKVRRAWKRTAGLSGLATVLVEAIGMFTFVLLVDILYRPGLGGRVALLALSAAAVLYLIVRHVIKPVARHIPDEQIALYVEERSVDFEGALMSAAEFGEAEAASAQQRAIIEAIVAEADSRAKRFGFRSAVDLSRLKKYGALVLAAGGAYLAIGLITPTGLQRHAARVLVPWRAPEDETGPDRLGTEDLGPITFTLSYYDARLLRRFRCDERPPRLLRGMPFDLEAQASRATADPVLFHFRPLAEMSGPEEAPPVPAIGEERGGRGGKRSPLSSTWRTLTMQEMEKLHGYRIALPDVNEDLAFSVSTGVFASDVHRIEVYDPLRLEGFEIGVKFPEYLQMPDELNEQATGDVSVPVGSTVTVRILTNGLLESGGLIWADGEEQELALVAGRAASAAASFPVLKDRSYNFTVRDINGQVRESSAPSLIHAIKDSPPVLEVVFPKIDIGAHPLAEVAFRLEAKDDWGVASVDLVYRVGIEEDSRPVRISLELEPKGPAAQKEMTTVGASHDMLFETFEPALEPGDLMTYHFEVRDRKSHAVMSDIFFIAVRPFEVWGTWLPLPPEGGAGEMSYVPATLERYTAAAWHLYTQRDSLSREEYERACEKLADEFTVGGVNLWDYVREPP